MEGPGGWGPDCPIHTPRPPLTLCPDLCMLSLCRCDPRPHSRLRRKESCFTLKGGPPPTGPGGPPRNGHTLGTPVSSLTQVSHFTASPPLDGGFKLKWIRGFPQGYRTPGLGIEWGSRHGEGSSQRGLHQPLSRYARPLWPASVSPHAQKPAPATPPHLLGFRATRLTISGCFFPSKLVP